MDDAVGRPFRLGDRLLRAARDERRLAERAVRLDRCDPQPAGIPRHVRVVPLEPGQAAPIRRDPRRGQEVGSRDQDRRRLLAVERDRDDRGGRLALARVILADGDVPAPPRIGPQVGVPPRSLGRDRDRLLEPGVEPVEAPVREVREHDHAAVRHVRPAAVLVDSIPDVVRRRHDVDDHAVDPRPDEDPATALGRTALQPVRVVAVDRRLADADDVADDVVEADRRCPGAVWRDGRLGSLGSLDHVPWRHEATYSACSGVIASSVMPRAASLSRATSASIASGTT